MYEAVIGEDIEASMWASGSDPKAVAEAAVMGFAMIVMEDGDEGDYTVTIYRDPVKEDRNGDEYVIGWGDRGTCEVTIRSETDWTIGEIEWDGASFPPSATCEFAEALGVDPDEVQAEGALRYVGEAADGDPSWTLDGGTLTMEIGSLSMSSDVTEPLPALVARMRAALAAFVEGA